MKSSLEIASAGYWIRSLAIRIPRRTIMAIQIVMDRTGDR
jgi:hypothetical protein